MLPRPTIHCSRVCASSTKPRLTLLTEEIHKRGNERKAAEAQCKDRQLKTVQPKAGQRKDRQQFSARPTTERTFLAC